jgi:hypothetical protein
MNLKNPEGKRKELVEKFGFDTKYACHLVRLAYECEMILIEGTLDITRNNEHLKAIRRGEVTKEDIMKWFGEKELQLNKAYHDSKLRNKPDEEAIKNLLVSCLESHYGTIPDFKTEDKYSVAISEINEVLRRYNI